MADDRRVYSDEEFALILRKTAELASRRESSGATSAGLTLTEMKSAAAQAGLDPALVERAARMLDTTTPASPLEGLTGGPMRHHHEARFPVALDQPRAALLLSAVRIGGALAGRQDVGHSGPMGMTWHDGGESESLGVTAHPDEDGAVVRVALDRRGTLAQVAMFSGVGMFLGVLFAGSALYQVDPVLGIGGAIAAVGGALGIARSYWASSTRKARERIGAVMDIIERTLGEGGPQGAVHRSIGDGVDATKPAASDVEAGELKGT